MGKCSKFNVDFENATKNPQKILVFEIIVYELIVLNYSLLRREYFSLAVNVLKISLKILLITKSTFLTQIPTQWFINMVKVLSFRSQQCFGPFTMFLVEGSFKIGLFRQLSNHVFPSL